jgi:hypothetical protein
MIGLGKVGKPVVDHFVAMDHNDYPVPGISVGQFQIKLIDPDGVEQHQNGAGPVLVTIVDVGWGNYQTSFSPNKTGSWLLIVVHDTPVLPYSPQGYFWWGQRNNYIVYSQDLDDVGPGTGDHMQDIEVLESMTLLPLANTRVYVYNSAQTQLLAQGYTDVSGILPVNLNDGSYKVVLYRLGTHTFSNPHDLTVVAPYTKVTYHGTPVTIPSPTFPEGCMVYGYLVDSAVLPRAAVVEVRLVGQKQFTSGGLQVTPTQRQVTSASTDGYWQFELVRSSAFTNPKTRYAFFVDGISQCEFIVPDLNAVNFADLSENQVL